MVAGEGFAQGGSVRVTIREDDAPGQGDLFRFIHMAPVGLLDMAADGAIRLMNPSAVQILMPFTVTGTLDNLFRSLGAQGTTLKAVCDETGDRLGLLMHGFRVVRDQANANDRDGPPAGRERTRGAAPGQPTTLGISVTRAAPDRLIVALCDLTNLVEAEAEALEARARADQANAAKSRYLAGTSHELRQPLTAILGFSDVIANQALGPLPDRYANYAHHISEAARHLRDLVSDILDLAKIEAGQMTLAAKPLDLSELVARCLGLMAPQAEQGEVRLEANMPETLALTGDRRRLQQILLNLISNAVKFTRPGGAVRVSARAEADGTVEIVVEDTGIGIAPDDIPRVLEPFGQAPAGADRPDSTGLGLPVARGLVEAHGGTLALSSAPDVGTTVTVCLPSLSSSC